VTSPPYWGLRDYGVAGQLGLERTPDEYVARMVAVFREVRRVLRDNGVVFLNLGDSYAGNGTNRNGLGNSVIGSGPNGACKQRDIAGDVRSSVPAGLKPKDLVGIPWRVAFALQSDGWYLRSDIIWAKPNPMPESVTDRPTKSHEYVFLLSKSATYYYDAGAIAEQAVSTELKKFTDGGRDKQRGHGRRHAGFNGRYAESLATNGVPTERNARSVWTISTKPFAEAHFATMPVELAQRCIRAGSRVSDTVLDPFGGAGTTGLAAVGLARNAILIELNPEYAAMAERRINDTPLFAGGAA
jgi:DNA modification methylase